LPACLWQDVLWIPPQILRPLLPLPFVMFLPNSGGVPPHRAALKPYNRKDPALGILPHPFRVDRLRQAELRAGGQRPVKVLFCQ
jgi:hypothetical protein